MSRFYASMKGNRGEATRQGTAASGLSAHVRGWDIGARVTIHADGDTDVVTVHLTKGSNGGPERHVLTATLAPDGTYSTRITERSRDDG